MSLKSDSFSVFFLLSALLALWVTHSRVKLNVKHIFFLESKNMCECERERQQSEHSRAEQSEHSRAERAARATTPENTVLVYDDSFIIFN